MNNDALRNVGMSGFATKTERWTGDMVATQPYALAALHRAGPQTYAIAAL
jgi:hypothetical protein